MNNSRLPAPSVFRNCAHCGAFFINEEIVAVKPRQYCFRTEILPSQLICAFFEMQAEKRNVVMRDDIDQMCGQDIYLQGRKRIIDGVYKMGVKFRQARETIHIAIEMIDQYYLSTSQEMSAKAFKVKLMQAAPVILHQVTVLLIASKFDEIDDNITAIQDLREYVQKQVQHQQRRDYSLVPSFDSIVECERKLMVFFQWDLKFVLPLHIVRAYLANGVLFSNEFVDLIAQKKSPSEIAKLKAEWSRSITTESLSISDLIVSKGNVTYRSESSSDIAASIIYLARKNILEADSPDGKSRVPYIWPQELVMITRCTETKAKRILVEVLRPLENPTTQATAEKKEKKTSSQPQYQSAEHHDRGKRTTLLKSTGSVAAQGGDQAINSTSQRNLQSDPKILKNSAKFVESNNSARKSAEKLQQSKAAQIQAQAQSQRKDNVALMKLSVLSQKHNKDGVQKQSDLKVKHGKATVNPSSNGKSGEMNKTANVAALATERSQNFSEIYGQQQNGSNGLVQEERRRAATIKQKAHKQSSKNETLGSSNPASLPLLDHKTASIASDTAIAKNASFADISKPPSIPGHNQGNTRQAQSQRQLFQPPQQQQHQNGKNHPHSSRNKEQMQGHQIQRQKSGNNKRNNQLPQPQQPRNDSDASEDVAVGITSTDHFLIDDSQMILQSQSQIQPHNRVYSGSQASLQIIGGSNHGGGAGDGHYYVAGGANNKDNGGLTTDSDFYSNDHQDGKQEEQSDTVEAMYYNDLKRRSTQPCSKQTLPTIVSTARSNVVMQTCEKSKEPSAQKNNMGSNNDYGPLSDRTYGSATILNEAGYLNPKPSVASVSSILPTDMSAQPFSSSRRPKNELGFQDETNVSKPTEDQQSKTPFADVEEEAQESDEIDDSKEDIPVARSSDLLPKPTKPQQPSHNTKNKAAKASSSKPAASQQQQHLSKQKYLEIKRNQMAKKHQQQQQKLTVAQNNAARFHQTQQSQHLQFSSSDISAIQSPPEVVENTARHNVGQRGLDNNSSAGYHDGGGSSLMIQPQVAPAGPSTARDQLQSQQSNEYFSVRPKMMDHANQLALQQEQIRSSSIEYESHHHISNSDYSSILPTDYNNSNVINGGNHKQHHNRRWTVRTTTTTNTAQANGQSGKVVPMVPGSMVKQTSGDSSNTTQNKLAASQVSFFKRENQTKSMLSNNSAVKNKSILISQQQQHDHHHHHHQQQQIPSNPGSAQEIHQNGNHGQNTNRGYSGDKVNGKKSAATTSKAINNGNQNHGKDGVNGGAPQMTLPQISERKPHTASTNQILGGQHHQPLNFDFSAAVERFVQKPSTAKNGNIQNQIVSVGNKGQNQHPPVENNTNASSQAILQLAQNHNQQPQQQVKYLTKTSGGLQSLRGVGGSNAVGQGQGTNTAQNNKTTGNSGKDMTTQGLLRSNHASQSMRHMQPSLLQTYDHNDLQQSANINTAGISKNKSSIFGGNNQNTSASNATKSINGQFGSTNSKQQAPQPQTLSSSKGFCQNQIRKGPSFNQMNYIATPTSILEQQQNAGHHSSHSKLLKESAGSIHERKISAGHHGQQSFNHTSNFKQNSLIQAPNHHAPQSHHHSHAVIHHHSQHHQGQFPSSSATNSHHLRTNSNSKGANTNPQTAVQSSRFAQHSNTLKQVAADEAFASLRAVANANAHHSYLSNPTTAGAAQNATDQLPLNTNRTHHFSKTASKEQMTQNMPKVSSNPVLRNSLDGFTAPSGSTALRHHNQSHGGQQQLKTSKKVAGESSSSTTRIRQMPSNMMPNSQPMYGNKRNHATISGHGGAQHLHHLNHPTSHHGHHGQHQNHHHHNGTSGVSKSGNKLLTVEQNKTSSFLAGQQQQMVTSHTTKQLIPGRSYESVKMLPRQSQQQSHHHQHQNGRDNTRGSTNVNPGSTSITSPESRLSASHNQNSIAPPNAASSNATGNAGAGVLTISTNSGGNNGYQNLRLRTLKQGNNSANQQQEMKHSNHH